VLAAGESEVKEKALLSVADSKSHDGDKCIPAPPSSPLRKQELENLK